QAHMSRYRSTWSRNSAGSKAIRSIETMHGSWESGSILRHREPQFSLIVPALTLLALLAFVWVPAAEAVEPRQAQNHIIVFYDLSAVLNSPGSLPAARAAVTNFLAPTTGANIPLWEPGSCISFVASGLNAEQLRHLQQADGDFWRQWSDAIIRRDAPSPLCADDPDLVRETIDSSFAGLQKRAVLYGLSSFAGASLFTREPIVYAQRLIVVRISDFALDSQQLRRLDESYFGAAQNKLLQSAAREFESSFHRKALDRARAGSLVVEVFEVEPAPPAVLEWSNSVATAQQLRSGWKLELPQLRGQVADAVALRFATAEFRDGDARIGKIDVTEARNLVEGADKSRIWIIPRAILDQRLAPSTCLITALDYS